MTYDIERLENDIANTKVILDIMKQKVMLNSIERRD